MVDDVLDGFSAIPAKEQRKIATFSAVFSAVIHNSGNAAQAIGNKGVIRR
jgi:N-acetylglutamate synthase/N-acetylornithine aminotransferase